MKIKCVANTNKIIQKDLLTSQPALKTYSTFALEIGKEYLVYALEISKGYIWYFICDEERDCNDPCPFWNPYPAALFEITDDRLSRYWRFNDYVDENTKYNKIILAIPEWARDPVSFYTKFVDRDQRAVDYFRKYKQRMDLEFPDSNIKKAASILEKDWMMCPNCGEAWEDVSTEALLRCQKCFALLNNPNYQPRDEIKY